MCTKKSKKTAMAILLSILLLCYGIGNVHCATVHENSEDLHALLDFKQSITSDPKGALTNWNITRHFCRWKGVICTSTRPWRVTELNVSTQRLEGEITSSLTNMKLLKKIDLSVNRLSGHVPTFNGLPLETLFLNGNSLYGSIPPELGTLSNLVSLDLSANNLTGIIPPTLQNLTRLDYFNVKRNQLEGSIPDVLWQLPTITNLLLGFNRLSGEIPQVLPNQSYLQYLSLEYNMLNKALPPNIGNALPSLVQISLANNKFEGHIPDSLSNARGLEVIDLSSNNFFGQVPASLGKLSRLIHLNLEANLLQTSDIQGWEFLYALRNCTSLKTLSLYCNHLQGVLPASVGNLSIGLESLTLGENNLSGIIPPSIGNLANLNKLGLGSNSLSGEIGEWVGKLQNIGGLFLGNNNLNGPIPSFIGNLSQLTILILKNNKLEGLLPPSLGNISQLSVLDLGYNNLQGNIPPEFGNLKQLVDLYLSSNKLTGRIPDDLGKFQIISTIQMDQNVLTGSIPISFGKLLTITTLNLSHNNLSGNIPLALGNLPLLAMLDLSYNDLEGQIPRNGVFQNSTAVSLSGNRGLCGGAIDLRMPSCAADSRRIGSRSILIIKILIPIFGFLSLLLLVYFLLIEKKTSSTKYLSMPDIGENFPKVSYSDLAEATKNFSESNMIGRGSYSSVYRGKFKEFKTEVAVKVFNLELRDAERSFMSECEALRSIQHRNLLPIMTACSTVDNEGNVFKALVYEFMPKLSLDRWLHRKGNEKSPVHLGLTQRISIAVNIADALDYLHHDSGRPIVHCDLKPSNILLDDDMTALLGDFGIARFYVDSLSTSANSVGLRGTIGYIGPEYAGGGHVSTSGDVYSFGIVLLEMMTGKRPTDPIFKDGLDIVNFVESSMPHQIFDVIDTLLAEEIKDLAQGKMVTEEHAVYKSVLSLLQVALSCARPLPSERTNMKQIAGKMHAIKDLYLEWNTKSNCNKI